MEQSKAEFLRKAADLYDRVSVMDQALDAIGRGDRAEAKRLMPHIQLSAGTLLAYKEMMGPEFIREWNMNTTKADKEFGPDWLDREDI